VVGISTFLPTICGNHTRRIPWVAKCILEDPAHFLLKHSTLTTTLVWTQIGLRKKQNLAHSFWSSSSSTTTTTTTDLLSLCGLNLASFLVHIPFLYLSTTLKVMKISWASSSCMASFWSPSPPLDKNICAPASPLPQTFQPIAHRNLIYHFQYVEQGFTQVCLIVLLNPIPRPLSFSQYGTRTKIFFTSKF